MAAPAPAPAPAPGPAPGPAPAPAPAAGGAAGGNQVVQVAHVNYIFHISQHPEQSKDIVAINTVKDIQQAKQQGQLEEGQDVHEEVDGCAAQYISTPALWMLTVVCAHVGHAIDRLKKCSGHGRSENDAAGGAAKGHLKQEQKKGEESKVESSAEDFGASACNALNEDFSKKAPSFMNRKRSAAFKLENKAARNWTKKDIDDAIKEIGGRAPIFKTAVLNHGFHMTHHFRADPRDNCDGKLGIIRYRRFPCACDCCLLSPYNDYNTDGCTKKKLFTTDDGDYMNEWDIIDLNKYKDEGKSAAKQQKADAADATAMAVSLQEVSDLFATSVEPGKTYAMRPGPDDVWFFKASSLGEVVSEEFIDPVMEKVDVEDGDVDVSFVHRVGDVVVRGNYWEPAGDKHLHLFHLDEDNAAAVPAHMIIRLEGFEMEDQGEPAKPKSKKAKVEAKALAGAKHVPDEIWEDVQAAADAMNSN